MAYDLTPRMVEVLAAMLKLREAGDAPSTPNEIAWGCGFSTGSDRTSRDGRRMAPAQRVIFPLIALRRGGYVTIGRRRDGLSGTGYSLTRKGERRIGYNPLPGGDQ